MKEGKFYDGFYYIDSDTVPIGLWKNGKYHAINNETRNTIKENPKVLDSLYKTY